MKKSSLISILSLLNGETIAEPDTIKAEIEAELAKGKAKADANREMYAQYHTQVLEALRLAGKPVSAQDIATETKIARGKVVYGLKNYWAAEVNVDDSGKTRLYSLKS